MKKNNLWAMAIISAALIFGGCGMESSDAATHEVDMTEVVTPIETTVPYIEPEMRDFEFSEEIWAVEREDGDGYAYLVRYAVVGQNDNIVDVLPWFTSDVDELRESLSYGPDIEQIDMSQVYRNQYDAMEAVAEAHGETFESYWGEVPEED